tara:strand:- start:253 stop:3102 length:2850 start_codon:yes stop_codon:yes gene_type:complete
MTDKEIEIWKSTIEKVLKTNEDWPENVRSERYYVEFEGIKMPSKIVLSRAVRIIEAEHPDIEIESLGGGLPTNQFIESFGFKITEDLVYNKSDKSKLVKHVDTKINNRTLFQDFIQYGYSLLKELDIEVYKVRMAIEADGDLSIIVGMRAAYSYSEEDAKSYIGFLISPLFKKQLEEKYSSNYSYNYKGLPDQCYIKLQIDKWSEIDPKVLEEFKKQFRLQYEHIKDSKRTQWNVEATTTNNALKYILFKNLNINEFMSESNEKLVFDKDYFNISDVQKYGKKVNETYVADSDEARWFYDTREKLYYLVELLGKRLNETFEIVYREKPNGQRGPGLIGFKDYVLAGFAPQGYNIGDNLFMKFEFSTLKENPAFCINIDLNFRKAESSFANKREDIFNSHHLRWPLNNEFPDNWNDLIDLIEMPVKRLTEVYKSYVKGSSKIFQTDNILEQPKNQILYGPPGTGKTYTTKEKAVKIIKPTFEQNQHIEDIDYRTAITEEYNKLYKEKSIHFTTFHQSLSYEDFIEGIKPVLTNMAGEAKDISYTLEAGIFKRCCAYAAYNCYKILRQNIKKSASGDYDFDELYEAFISQYRNVEEKPLFKTITGRSVEIFEINKNDSIRARAKGSKTTHVAPLTKENIQKLYDSFKSYKDIHSLQDVKDTVGVTPRITEFYAVFKGLKDFEAESFHPVEKEQLNEIDLNTEEEEEILKKFDGGVYDKAMMMYGKDAKPVVLIIDEINRGNVSAIFGELITLLEPDKRLGQEEGIKVKLPYSQDAQVDFGVPPNLYLIGTMNTADRSVEALDTALRRRFSFEEIMPQPELFAEVVVAGFNLKEVLETINLRIEALLDRDHTIGHSYFFKVKDATNKEEALKQVFKDNIIPLLQEYFYGDYSRIGLVLGEGFIEVLPVVEKNLFANFNKNYNDVEVGESFEIKTIDTDFDIAVALNKLMNRA